MKNYIKNILISFLTMFSLTINAEDIDLFVGASSSSADLPNVLIILDNTANWSSPFDNEITALKDVVNSLPVNRIRLGLMMFTESGGANSGNDGAYVKAAIRDMTSTNKIKYSDMVNALDKNADKSNGGKVAKAMEEAYLYFSGGIPHAGNNKVKTDFTGNTAANNPVASLGDNALASKSATVYQNPILSSCAKNFIIYISNGPAQDNTQDLTQARNALAAVGGSTATISITPSGSQDNLADEWSRFMKKSDQRIKTYTIDVDKGLTGQGPGWTALLKSMASVSEGGYYAVTSSTGSEIAKALNSIFSEIQADNSVFASVSLPVSVNTQGTFLNQIFIGMFRPDAGAKPRWNGNLKQYKFAVLDKQLQLVDADNNRAINTNTGFITECARSFWTPNTPNTYWSFKPDTGCLTAAIYDVSDTPDGDIVEKGAQAYTLRQTSNIDSTRIMKSSSCIGNSCTLADFTASMSSLDANLVKWAKGADVKDENINNVFTDTRPSVHGDVVHSRPVAINYGTTDATPQVVVFYGGNDGLLRAINGNRPVDNVVTDNISGKTPGSELWSFMPPEFHAKIKRLYDNEVQIKFPGQITVAGAPTPAPKDYGFDGSIAAYKTSTKAYIYASMRRGGRSIYAFDVSNINTSLSSPTLLWRAGCPNATNDDSCSSGMTGIGQTWSTPKVIQAQGYTDAGGVKKPLIIMGGGYDATCHDDDTDTLCTSPKGNKIYVLDGVNGTLQQTLNTTDSVVGDITIVPDSLGNIKYAYAADLGGNMYRISGSTANAEIGSTLPANWTITKIASLGGAGVNKRKFMFGPDVVDDNGTYFVMAGTGDREKPLASYPNANQVNNYFYTIKDKPTDTTWLSSESTNCGSSVVCNNSLVLISGSATPSSSDLAAGKGWYLALAAGEKVVTSAITVFGTVTFSTHIPTGPTSGQCDTLGTATVYNVSYKDADPVNDNRGSVVAGGGLPPSPVAGMVTLDDGRTVPFVIGGGTGSPLEPKDPPVGTGKIRPKSRVYWNIKK